MKPQYRYFIKLAYKGTAYHGWQVQNNAVTVQEVLDAKLTTLLQSKIDTTGAGRTDTGVHAREFYAHFDHSEQIVDKKDFLYHLNCLLPADIAVSDLLEMQPDAHARFDATARSYEYVINRERNPFEQDYAYYLYSSLDVEKMNQAAEYLKEVDDFSSFCKGKVQVKTKLCDVTEAYWEEQGSKLIFHITANRFLRNMVRAIVGTLIEIGQGKITLDEYKEIIASKKRAAAGYSVPGQGLFLTKIEYPKTIFAVER